MVFASLLVVGVSTLLQVRRLGPAGAGAVLPMFTAAFAIPFCITALVDGGPATLTTLIIASALFQLVISKWLFVLRRVVTPIVSGTVIMILSITLASVVFALLDDAAQEEPAAAPLDRPCHPGHSCRTDIEGHTGDAVVGTGNRYRRWVCSGGWVGNLRH